MKKIVLLAINAKYVHSSLSVWVIAAGVAKFSRISHDVSVIEATINQPLSFIADAVAKSKPDVIGISSYIWNAGILPDLLVLLKERLSEVIIILGGPEASHNNDFWLNNGADHVLQGEGEYIFPQWLDAYAAESRQGDGSSVLSSRLTGTDELSPCLDEPVDPYNEKYFSTLNGRLSYIEASRGCPFKCAFCLSAGSEVRFFSLDTIKKQILRLSQAETKTIKFIDRTFNCNIERAIELFEFVIGLETNCCFHFEVAADLFDEKMLSILETAPRGRIQLEIGLQSFFKPALKASFRQLDTIKAEQNIRALIKMRNIHIHVDLIAGLPYETLPDFIETFDRAFALNVHNLQLGFLKLLHGSDLRRQSDALDIKYDPLPPYEITSSPWLCSDDLQILKSVDNALVHTVNKGRFLSTFYYMQTVTGERPFSLMHLLGTAVPNNGMQLEDYIVHIFEFFVNLPNVDKNDLIDCMLYDWLSMVKGKNMPDIFRNEYQNRSLVAEEAKRLLGRKIRREEYTVLNSGLGIFVDSNDRDPVTGLYKVYLCG